MSDLWLELGRTSWTLMELAWKSTLILSVALVLHSLVLRRWLLARDLMWSVTTLMLLLLPIGNRFLATTPTFFPSLSTVVSDDVPVLETNVMERPNTVLPSSSLPNTASAAAETAHPSTDNATQTHVQASSKWPLILARFLPWVTIFYFPGVVIAGGRTILAFRAWTKLRDSAAPLCDSDWVTTLGCLKRRFRFARPVLLSHSPHVRVPLTGGWWRPCIVLPSTMVASANEQTRRLVLQHELIHIARSDFLYQLLEQMNQAVYWYNPLVRIAGRQARQLREMICDGNCVLDAADRDAYVQLLLSCARLQLAAPPQTLGLSMVRHSVLETRLSQLQPSKRIRVVFTARITGLAVGLMLIFLLGGSADSSTDALSEKVEDAPDGFRYMQVRTVDEQNKPIEVTQIYVSVWPKPPHDGLKRYYHTDARGEVDVLVPDSPRLFRVWTKKSGYVPHFVQWWPELQADGKDIPQSYTFTLPTGSTIGGTVNNERGEPIEGASVEVMLQNRRNELGRIAVPSTWLAESSPPDGNACTTDANGRWSLNNVPRGDHIQVALKLTHPRYVSDAEWGNYQREQKITMDSLRSQKAVIAMREGVVLSGAITDPDGQPISNALVIWGDDPYLQTASQEVRADGNGIYRMSPLPPKPVRVTVVAKGFSPETRVIDLGDATRSGDFALSAGRTLRIRFLDPDGKPIPDVHVSIRRWRNTKSLYNHQHPNVLDTGIPSQSNQDGVYEWTWAPIDLVDYSFGLQGFQAATQSLVADVNEYTVVLKKDHLQPRVPPAARQEERGSRDSAAPAESQGRVDDTTSPATKSSERIFAQEPPRDELVPASIRGTWTFVNVQSDLTDQFTKEALKNHRMKELQVTADQFQWTDSLSNVRKGEIIRIKRLGEDSRWEVDFSIESEGDPHVRYGLLEVQEDRLRLCFNTVEPPSNARRPLDSKLATPNLGNVLFEYDRKK